MFIKKLIIKNILGTENREIEFKDKTNISGPNGIGKSTIKEAILFGLYGRIYGTDKVDTAIKNGSENMYVFIEGDYNDVHFTIERVRDKKSSIIKYNGNDIKQEVLDSIFGTYKLFVSSVCVGDFMKLEDNDKIDIINKIFPSNKEEIYKKIVGEDIAKKFPYSITLEKDIENSYNETKNKIESIRHNKVLISSKIEELEKQEVPVCTINESILNSIKNRIVDFESTKPVLLYEKSNNPDLIEFKKQLDTIEIEYQNHLQTMPDRKAVDKLLNSMSELEKEIKLLETNNVCGSCGRPFDDITIQKGKLSHKLEEIKTDGKMEVEVFKNNLNAYNIKKSKYEEEIKNIKDKIFLLQIEEDKIQKSTIDSFNENLSNYENKLQELKEEYNTKSDELKNYLIKKEQYESITDTIQEHKRKLQDYDKELATLDLLVIEKVKNAFGTKGIEFEEIKSKTEIMKTLFPENTEIELMRKNKSNDNYTKVFNIIVDGVSYNWLSKGMKKIIDISLSKMVSSKLNYGLIIIDDLESLTSELSFDNKLQVITMTATNKVSEFSIY